MPGACRGGSWAAAVTGPVDGLRGLSGRHLQFLPMRCAALSPSRRHDFMQVPAALPLPCDRPAPPGSRARPARTRHARPLRPRARLRPPCGRAHARRGCAMVAPQWAALLEAEPELAELVDGDDPEALALAGQGPVALVERWFSLEDPTRLEPAERELYVETDCSIAADPARLRRPAGRRPHRRDPGGGLQDRALAVRAFEGKALFQMKFYALVLWRLHGTVPRMLQLVYLGNSEIVRYSPDEADLRATERKLKALWRAIEHAATTGDWRPRTSRLCDWCDHRALCPAWGGTPPRAARGRRAPRAQPPLLSGRRPQRGLNAARRRTARGPRTDLDRFPGASAGPSMPPGRSYRGASAGLRTPTGRASGRAPAGLGMPCGSKPARGPSSSPSSVTDEFRALPPLAPHQFRCESTTSDLWTSFHLASASDRIVRMFESGVDEVAVTDVAALATTLLGLTAEDVLGGDPGLGTGCGRGHPAGAERGVGGAGAGDRGVVPSDG